MSNLFKILKGSLIGIGSILPGVSGGVIAASFNVYEELINALNMLIKAPFKAIKLIWQYLIGIVIGVIIGYFVIVLVFYKAPLPITFLFIGIIIGQLPEKIQKIRFKEIQWHHLAVLLFFMLIMVGVLFLPSVSHNFDGIIRYLIYFLIGLLIAISLIVPGLSGTMLLMALGFYSLFLNLGSLTKDAIIDLDMKALWGYFPVFLVLILGLILGALLIAKPIGYALKKVPKHFDFAVLGIILVAPINILFSLKKENDIDILNDPSVINVFDAKWYIWVISGVLLVFGFLITYFVFRRKEHQKSATTP